MHTFVNRLDMSLYPVPLGETLGEMAPLTVEDALSLSVAVLVPCLALSSIPLSGIFLAPALAAEAVIIPTSTVFVPGLGICAFLFAMAACGLAFLLGGFCGKWRGACSPS
ncbi:hypothetical protein B0H19DRAFT_1095583 [Mycena capillaripes]|nr:hypothetical protein B0H19DRAFT_1095583 [Mycena capillaripes]